MTAEWLSFQKHTSLKQLFTPNLLLAEDAEMSGLTVRFLVSLASE